MTELIDRWAEARARWEAEPRMTFAALAEWMGVDRRLIVARARRERWVKVERDPDVRRAANEIADQAEQQDGPIVNAPPGPAPAAESIERAVELRAKLIQHHRAEWRKHAAMFPIEKIAENYKLHGCAAKISAETISIRQKSERIAWGLDDEQQKQGDVIIRWQG